MSDTYGVEAKLLMTAMSRGKDGATNAWRIIASCGDPGMTIILWSMSNSSLTKLAVRENDAGH